MKEYIASITVLFSAEDRETALASACDFAQQLARDLRTGAVAFEVTPDSDTETLRSKTT